MKATVRKIVFDRKCFFCGVSVLLASTLLAPFSAAETCQTAPEIDAATRTSIQNAAVQAYILIAKSDTQSLASKAVAEIANNTAALDSLLQGHKKDLAGSSAVPRNTYLLETGGTETLVKAEFFCGVFNSPGRLGFTLSNLAAGRYALVVMEVQTARSPYFYSLLLSQKGSEWRIAGIFPHAREIGRHDSAWYWQRARDFKTKGQARNAWFYYLAAKELAAPVPFMSTLKLDSFYDEVLLAMPADLPEQKQWVLESISKDAQGNARQFMVTNLFAVPGDKGEGLDLVFKYHADDISDTNQTFLDNKEAMKALLAAYPEFREGFANLVARAVTPGGQDLGSMLPMKDVK